MTILLHGFWGQPADWNRVLQRLPLGWPVTIPDLYQEGELSARHDLHHWCEHFDRWLEATVGEEPVDLVGYSMGGRLALNAIAKNPKRVRRALLLSTRPYFPTELHSERRQWEAQWADRFRELPWPELETLWQSEPVFGSSAALSRRHEDRELLADSLVRWSVCEHLPEAARTAELPGFVDWAFGALDQKFLPVAKALQEAPVKGQISVIENAGHRLLVEAEGFITDWIQAKLDSM